MVSFFFNDTATTEIYTLSLHDALPIWDIAEAARAFAAEVRDRGDTLQDDWLNNGPASLCKPASAPMARTPARDRKSTRLNSSHGYISYAVFCLKKKKNP